MPYPTSTYRLQFREGMTLDKAATLVPYWKALGVSHLYAAPIFSATPGSTHGYDVTDPNRIDPALGGEEGFDRLSQALKADGIGLILDIVPNHMAASLDNPWWRSLVEWGADSPYARYYDIDWSQPLTLPFLGDPGEKVLTEGGLRLALDREAGALALDYAGTSYPLAPATYAQALGDLDDPMAAAMLLAVSGAQPATAQEFHDAVRTLFIDNGRVDALQGRLDAVSRDGKRLKALIEAQAFRLIFWKDAAKGLSYRRFFEVAGLVGLRVEDEAVFKESHRLVIDLVRAGKIDGLRLDHIDGLSDPDAYLRRLRAAVGPNAYIIVEKILGEGETLPQQWPISGTTGYEFIAALSNLLADQKGMEQLGAAYGRFCGETQDFEAILDQSKQLMIDENFAGEAAALARMAMAALPVEAALSREAVAAAISALLKAFHVYRTYGAEKGLDTRDRALLDGVVARARAADATLGATTLSAVAALLSGDVAQERAQAATLFRLRFQQVSGPVMAKSMEDTAFYRYNRFLALNEVGGEPGEAAFSVATFHEKMVERLATQPTGLSATSTHDTKRGEDARARLFALSEAPQVWEDAVWRWRDVNAGHATQLPDGLAPEPNVEWALYQALAGVWPAGLGTDDVQALGALSRRFAPYVEKMLREAKLRSNWSQVEDGYEQAVQDFCSKMLSPGNTAFLNDFDATLQPFVRAGFVNGLTQTLVKLTAPGIPDIYQGSETEDFSLVDPDNRRMPDFDRLWAVLQGAKPFSLDMHDLSSGTAKQTLIAKLLHLRQAMSDLFAKGDYRPLQVSGEGGDHIVAFARKLENKAVIVVAPMRVLPLVAGGNLIETFAAVTIRLPPDMAGLAFRDALSETGRAEMTGDIVLGGLASCPFGVLVTQDG